MDRSRPEYAKRIRTAREQAGLTPEIVAQRLGINDDWYWDVEAYDDEIVVTLSLAQVAILADVLGTRADHLLESDCAFPRVAQPLGFSELVAKVEQHLHTSGATASELEQEVGWELQATLRDPERFWQWNPAGLIDLCSALGICWLDALPRSTPPPGVPLSPWPA